jgi:hypothetical protein
MLFFVVLSINVSLPFTAQIGQNTCTLECVLTPILTARLLASSSLLFFRYYSSSSLYLFSTPSSISLTSPYFNCTNLNFLDQHKIKISFTYRVRSVAQALGTQVLLNLSLAVVLYTFDLNEEEKNKIQEACFRLNALQRPVTFVSTDCTQYELAINISPRPSKAAFPWVKLSQSNQRVPGITSTIPDPWRFFT